MNRKPSGRQYINYAFYKLSSNWYELSKNKRKNISQKLLNILENQETSADELLRKFNGVWEKDISKIFTINN